ncbi:MAG: SemiSWEET transporter [Methanomicrobiales archaeon]|nr:SemiSWEET transporter [Methanomicrobiales archaeon]
METVTTIGLVAGFCTTVSFLPQVVKTVKTHRADDLSFAMLLIFLVGLALWFFYGIAIGSLPIIIANSVTIGLVSVLILLKWRCCGTRTTG